MTDLTELNGIAGATADTLRDELGIETVNDLARADGDAVGEAVPHLNGHDAVAQASKLTILIQSGDEVAAEMDAKGFVTSGIPGLDTVLDGGFEEGMTAGIYGKSGQGKSQLAMHALISAVESTENPALYLETEPNNYRPDRIQAFASDPSSQSDVYKIGGVDTLEDQRNAYDAIRENFTQDSLSMVVIDSFNSHFRDEFVGREELSGRASVMKDHLNRLHHLAEDLRIPILLLLQSYGTPEAYGKQDTPYGGNVMIHNIGYFIRMSNGTGDLKEATVENHPGLPDKGVLLNIHDDGIDYVKDSS